jgi:hypothetical protein
LRAWFDHGSPGGGGDLGRSFPTLGDLVEISMGGMVWGAREWWYGHVTLLEVREDQPAGVCVLTRFKLWGGKIRG